MRTMLILALVLSMMTLTACSSGGKAGVPTDKPLVTGTITKQDGNSFLVEEKPGQQSGDTKCWFRLDTKTAVFRQSGKEVKPVTTKDLAVGQQVSAWPSGPVLESYPCQAGAGTFLILGDGQK